MPPLSLIFLLNSIQFCGEYVNATSAIPYARQNQNRYIPQVASYAIKRHRSINNGDMPDGGCWIMLSLNFDKKNTLSLFVIRPRLSVKLESFVMVGELGACPFMGDSYESLPWGLHKRLREGYGAVNDGVDWYPLKRCFEGSVLLWGMVNRELSVLFLQCRSIAVISTFKKNAMQRSEQNSPVIFFWKNFLFG